MVIARGWMVVQRGGRVALAGRAGGEDGHDERMVLRTITPERSWAGEHFGLQVSAGDQELRVARPVDGAAGCCWCHAPDVIVVASDAAMAQRSGYWQPEIDWGGLDAALRRGGLPDARTALTGLTELLPGEVLTIGAGLETKVASYWSPWDEIGRSALGDAAAAAGMLRADIADAVAQSAAPYRRVLVAVSGGLDSSVVAAALVATGKQVVAFTMYTDDADGDERREAAMLASALNLPLVARRYRLDDVDVDQPLAPALVRPIGRAQGLAFDRQARAVAAEAGTEALFTGNGGDSVFCLSRSGVALSDRLLACRSPSAWAATLRDLQQLTRAGHPRLLARAVRRALPGQRRYHWRADHHFLSTVAEERDRRLDHPWLHPPSAFLPGKMVHVAMLLRVQQAIQDYGMLGSAPVLSPLMAQCVVATALRVPTWRWIDGGRDRAVARRAFADILPEALLARRGKGGPDSFAIQILEAFRARIRARLLGGRLAAEGLLDVETLDRSLAVRGPFRSSDYVRLLQLLDAENWVRHWERAGGTSAPGINRHRAAEALP